MPTPGSGDKPGPNDGAYPSAGAGPGNATALAAVALAIVASILPVFLIGSLSIEIRRDLDYGESAGGLVLSSFFVASALVSSRTGRLIDKVGPRRGFTVALAGVLLAQILIAGVVTNPAALALAAAGSGVCNATAQLSANVFVATDLPVHRQGVGFAVKQSAMPGAALIAGLTLPSIALTVGWRWVFLIGGCIALLALILVRAALAEISPPTSHMMRSGPEDTGHQISSSAALGALAVAAAFSTAAAITLGGFFVESAIDAGVMAGTAGLAFACGSLISIVVRVLVGVAADRRQGNLLGAVAVMIGLGALTSVWFTWRTPIVQLVGVPIAFGAGWAWPGLFNLAVVRAVPKQPGRATGITQTGTYLGGAVGPILFGTIAEVHSFAAAWWLAAGLGLSAGVAVLVGRSALRSSGPHRPSRSP